MVALGSAYYHLQPDNNTLVWDRLPMTVAFTSLLAMIIAERIDVAVGYVTLWPLVLAGVFSVGFWHYTEQAGAGDLRPYGLIQFLPTLLIPLLIWLFPARYTCGADMLLGVALYVTAKLLEHFDRAIYSIGQVISGHTLKHLVAAAGCYIIIRMVLRRQPLYVAP